MTINPTTLVINPDNQILGVMQGDNIMNVDQYNSKFSSQNPVQIKQVNWNRIYDQIPKGSKFWNNEKISNYPHLFIPPAYQ